ncbi:biotin--[acetyl-CoA-carboxylase] ligase [Paenibacillaceae bacterium]|nr:biotin--[acetyl-CoA-carboxylase] ligase [Paenibacillaceae bacterium]
MSKQLLQMFENQDGQFVSGEEISKELQISRTAVWKQIQKLQKAGYQFEAATRKGYRLIQQPDKLSLQQLLPKLTSRRLGCSIKLHDVVESTQNIAKALAEDGAPEGTLVVAEQQLQGRGRLGRQWVSPPGKGIYMSLVLRPSTELAYSSQLTLLIAVALCRSLRTITGVEIGIKWPNDLLADNKKISGILLESAAEEERLRYLIAGIGISVNMEPEDYPPEVLEKAVSLKMLTGAALDRAEIIAFFLEELEVLYDLYNVNGFAPIRTLWEALSVSLHKETEVRTPQGILRGTPIGLNEHGALLLRDEQGSVRPVFSAELGSRN